MKKLTGENTRFIYGIGGKLVAEFDGSSGALKKEYIYGATGVVATIVPNAQPGSGTQYTTTDSLGSPRVVTNSSAGVVSRHDYMPFGEELGSGVGGRTAGMGYAVLMEFARSSPATSETAKQDWTTRKRATSPRRKAASPRRIPCCPVRNQSTRKAGTDIPTSETIQWFSLIPQG